MEVRFCFVYKTAFVDLGDVPLQLPAQAGSRFARSLLKKADGDIIFIVKRK